MSRAPEKELFDRAVDKTGYDPSFIAHLLLGRYRAESKNGILKNCNGDLFVESLEKAEKAGVIPDAILPLFEMICGETSVPPEDAIKEFAQPDDKKTEKKIVKYLKELEIPSLSSDKLKRYLMGGARKQFNGRIRGRRLADIVEEFITSGVDDKNKGA